MKMTINELRTIVSDAVKQSLLEAKKKSKKPKKRKPGDDVTDVPPHGYKHAKVYDYSKPLGKRNVIKAAGAANFGPYTGESVLRSIVAGVIKEQLALAKKSGRR